MGDVTLWREHKDRRYAHGMGAVRAFHIFLKVLLLIGWFLFHVVVVSLWVRYGHIDVSMRGLGSNIVKSCVFISKSTVVY